MRRRVGSQNWSDLHSSVTTCLFGIPPRDIQPGDITSKGYPGLWAGQTPPPCTFNKAVSAPCSHPNAQVGLRRNRPGSRQPCVPGAKCRRFTGHMLQHLRVKQHRFAKGFAKGVRERINAAGRHEACNYLGAQRGSRSEASPFLKSVFVIK